MKRNVICLVSVACFACLALSAADEPRLSLKPEKLPKGGNVVVCKNVAYGPRQIGMAKRVGPFCICSTVYA